MSQSAAARKSLSCSNVPAGGGRFRDVLDLSSPSSTLLHSRLTPPRPWRSRLLRPLRTSPQQRSLPTSAQVDQAHRCCSADSSATGRPCASGPTPRPLPLLHPRPRPRPHGHLILEGSRDCAPKLGRTRPSTSRSARADEATSIPSGRGSPWALVSPALRVLRAALCLPF